MNTIGQLIQLGVACLFFGGYCLLLYFCDWQHRWWVDTLVFIWFYFGAIWMFPSRR